MEEPVRVIIEYSREELKRVLTYRVENLNLSPLEVETLLQTPEIEVTNEANKSLYMPTRTLLKLAIKKRVGELREKSL